MFIWILLSWLLVERDRLVLWSECVLSHKVTCWIPNLQCDCIWRWGLYGCNYGGMCVRTCMLSHVQFFAAPWTVAHQAPLSMGFSRQEYWSGLPCPPPRYLPDPRIKPNLSCLLHWRAGSLPLVPLGKPDNIYTHLECVHSALYCRYFIRQNHRIGRDLWSILSFNRPQTY